MWWKTTLTLACGWAGWLLWGPVEEAAENAFPPPGQTIQKCRYGVLGYRVTYWQSVHYRKSGWFQPPGGGPLAPIRYSEFERRETCTNCPTAVAANLVLSGFLLVVLAAVWVPWFRRQLLPGANWS